MHPRKAFMLLVTLVISFLALSVWADDTHAYMIKMSPGDLEEGAEAIIDGKVQKIHWKWDDEYRLIYTYVTIIVGHTYKETLKPDEEITVLTEGGQAIDPFTDEMIWLWVEDEPVFQKEELVKLYLKEVSLEELVAKGLKPAAGVYSVFGLNQGKIGFDELYAEEQKLLNQLTFNYKNTGLLSTPVINSISPNVASAGTGSVLTVRGSGFGATRGSNRGIVFYFRTRTTSAGTTYRYMWSDHLSWADTIITTEVPTENLYHHEPGDPLYSYAAASGPLAFYDNGSYISFYPFTATFGYGDAKWKDAEVGYSVSTDFNEDQLAALIAAADTWNDAVRDFEFVYDGRTENTEIGRNKENQITFENLPAGVLGRARTWYTWWGLGGHIKEADFSISSNFTWSALPEDSCPSGAFDLESVALHELGHWLRLLDLYGDRSRPHRNDTEKVMYGHGASGQTNRELHLHDILGIQWIYDHQTFGTLRVTIEPEEAIAQGAQWCLEGDSNWYNSGEIIELVPGDYTITYRNLYGWDEPKEISVSVVSARQTNQTGQYLPSSGTLLVNIEPAEARADGARWSSDGGATWNKSGAAQTVPIGDYTVTFKEITGWDTPAPVPVTVLKDTTHIRTAHYHKKVYTISVSARPELFGTVDGGGSYEHGTEVTVTAAPGPHFIFINWTEHGAEVSKNREYTFTATSSRTLRANFEELAFLENNLEGEINLRYGLPDLIISTFTGYLMDLDPNELRHRVEPVPGGRVTKLIVGLNFPGSELSLSVYDPLGQLYAEQSSSEPPIILGINNAAEGEWLIVVNPVDLPYQEYPYAAMIGECSVMLGDVNDDDDVDVADVILILRHIVGLTPLTGYGLIAADANLDSRVDVADAIMILRYIVGLVPSLP